MISYESPQKLVDLLRSFIKALCKEHHMRNLFKIVRDKKEIPIIVIKKSASVLESKC